MIKIFHQLIDQGNSLVVVDHETAIIDAADWIIEIGPGSGANGGTVIDQGTPKQIHHSQQSLIRPFLTGEGKLVTRQVAKDDVFAKGSVSLTITHKFNLNDVTASSPSIASLPLLVFLVRVRQPLSLMGCWMPFKQNSITGRCQIIFQSLSPRN